jgi:hypothetical protein
MNRALVGLGLIVASALPWAGCSQQATTVPVRSLERSGRVSFACLRNNKSAAPGTTLDTCFPTAVPFAITDYASGPHAIALVTQTTRGEIAVIDVTAQSVLDADPSVPGFNFLPVGALPTDIVSTPGGNATFVASGDPLRPGLFAIPSARLPGQLQSGKTTLASWPACSLPGVPTELTVVPDSTGSHTGLCNPSTPATPPAPGLDLSNEMAVFGRLKIFATMPELGQIVVIDAQELLTRAPGSFDQCPIESRIQLNAVLPGEGEIDAGLEAATPEAASPEASISDASTPEASTDDAMVGEAGTSDGAAPSDGGTDADAGPPVDPATCSGRVAASPPASKTSHPGEMALSDDGRLFISDDQASVIHVLDVADPCNVVERPPLLPFSLSDPTRAVVTSSIAVSPLTTDMKRYVYAVDARGGGNVMVFDVSANATTRRPLPRPDRHANPFEPPDRLSFSSAVQGLVFATRELPQAIAPGGTLPRGIKCDPSVTDMNDPAYKYRPDNFSLTGAGPRVLRGTFAFAALSSGRIAVVDIEDYDQACRRPALSDDPALGCSGTLMLNSTKTLFSASGEASCNVVERHRVRSNVFVAHDAAAGRHAPAMQTPPVLYDKTGSLLSTDPMRTEAQGRPRLLGPSMPGKTLETRAELAAVLSGSGIPDDATDPDLASDPARSERNWVTFDLVEPRAHVDQTWFLTYEGALPSFVGRRGRFQCLTDKKAIECEGGANPSSFVLFDSSVGFCDQGAQGVALAEAQGLPSPDFVQITEGLPDPADPYWTTVADVCSPTSCQTVYGTPDVPGRGREFPIDTAFEDRLVLQPSTVRATAPLACCFPYPISYTVRAGKQWLVTGSATGYVHHEIPDPTAPNASTARCILSCDSNLELRNSRAVELARGKPVPKYDDKVGVFRNPQVRFVLWGPANCPGPECRAQERDTFFSFVETGGFIPLEVGLSTLPVMVQSVRFIRGLDQLALPDAVSQGLMLFDIGALSANGVRVFN